MSWFDSISDGASSAIDWMRNLGGGGGGGGSTGQSAPAQAPAAGNNSGGAAASTPWAESGWAKATGIGPWAQMLGAARSPDKGPAGVFEPKAGTTTMEERVNKRMVHTEDGTDATRIKTPGGTGEDFQNVGQKFGATMRDARRGEGNFKKQSEFETGWTPEGKRGKGFGMGEKGGFQLPSYGKWKAPGQGKFGGTYSNKTEALEEEADGKKKAAAPTGPPKVWQPSLDKIGNSDPNKPGYDPRSTGYNRRSGVMTKEDVPADTEYDQAGSFRSSKYGSYSGRTGFASQKWDDKAGKMVDDPNSKFQVGHEGKGSMGLAGWEGQWGAEEKGGWRSTHVSKDGNTQSQHEAGWVASGGASGSYGLDTAKGAYAQGGFGGKAGVYAQSDWDTKTKLGSYGGADIEASGGFHGDAFAGVKAGASAEAGFGPDFIGAKGDIGAFAGAEAQGDVHGKLGPVGGKVGGSVMAGAGIGAEGDLSYKDGKFHFGGKAFAALGYGGSLSADVTIDVGAAYKMGKQAGSDAISAVGDAGVAVGKFGADVGAGAAHYGGQAISAVGDAGSAALSGAGNAVSAVLSW